MVLKYNLKDVDKVGEVMRYYYKSQDILMEVVNKDKKPDSLLG